jgi:uncharacterized damage-inducible protein DinB
LVDVAYGWRTALQNMPDDGVLDEVACPDVASLQLRWEAERTAWTSYLAALSDADLQGVWHEEGSLRRTRWQTIVHVMIEGAHHRSEAAAMLTGYGQSPGEIDFEGWLVWSGQ